jgi:outer membrane protein
MTLQHRLISLAALLLVCLPPGHACAAEKPLWELGIGMSALSFPDYRGSDETHLYALPFPYIVYRGDFLKADRHGIRGTLFDNDRIELNVSVAASLPVNSNENRARQGMPDLQPTLEFGPSLDLNLWRTDNRRYKLDLRLPVREAFTVKGGVDDIGWVFSPRLNLDVIDVAGLPGWNLGVLAGPMYGSERNHEYFYAVAPQYATASRPAYAAKSGYAGAQFLMAVSKRYPTYWVGGFARWDTLKGAAFADSPLLQRDHYFAAGIGIAWILGESSTRVEAVE